MYETESEVLWGILHNSKDLGRSFRIHKAFSSWISGEVRLFSTTFADNIDRFDDVDRGKKLLELAYKK